MVRFAKTVDLANPKLQALHWVIFTGVCSAYALWFVSQRKWLVNVDVSSRFATNMWAQVAPHGEFQERARHAMNYSNFCTSPHKLDYWWDTAGAWIYENYTCLPPCARGVKDLTCLTPVDMARRFAPHDMTIPLSYVDQYYTNAESSIPHSSKWSLVPSADFQTVSIAYSYDVREADFTSHGNARMSASTAAITGFDRVTTVVLNQNKKVWRVYGTSTQSIDLTIHELLFLAGEDGALNKSNALGTPNLKPNATIGGPNTRITGIQLDVWVECYTNPEPHVEDPQFKILVDTLSDKSVCLVSVKRVVQDWVVRDDFLPYDSGWLHRKIYGLRVVVKVKAMFEFWHPEEILWNIIALSVVMSYPSLIMRFIAAYMLGHLSKMYRRALVEYYDVSAQCAAATTRLLASSACYASLQNTSDTGLSLRRILHSMRFMTGGRLDLDEIRTLGHFCLQQIATPMESHKTLTRKELQELGLSANPRGPTDHISCEAFIKAHMSSDTIDFDDLTQLFDKDRRVCLMEHCFTPVRLWKHVHGARCAHHDSSSSASPHENGAADPWQIVTDLQSRVEAAERQLAESERHHQAWKQKSLEMLCNLDTVEKRLRAIESLLGRCSENSAVVEDVAKVSRESDLRASEADMAKEVQRE